MLLNYDFLESVDEPQRNTSLTASIDKALADKKLARQNKPRVRVKDNLSLSETLDAYGRELSRLKSEQNTTIKATRLGGIVNKIKSGLPFGTISAFRPFKDAFYKDFTEKQRDTLIYAYKSGADPKNTDIIAEYWLSNSVDLDPYDPIKVDEFFHPQPENGKETTKFKNYKDMIGDIYAVFYHKLGRGYVDKFFKNRNSTMRDFMSSDKFVKTYRYTRKENMERTQQLKSLLDQKRHFLGYLQVTGYWKDSLNDPLLPSKEVSFFVFQNEPSNSFDLKDQLLDLAKYFNQEAICYCQNAETGKVDLVLATEKDFEVDMTFTGITFTIPLTQSITRLHNKVYTFFDKQGKDNYGVFFDELSTTKLKAMSIPKIADEFYRHLENRVKSFIRARQYHGSPRTFDADDIEKYELQAIKRLDLQRCAKSKSFKASYNHNIKIRKVANALRQGKKVSRTLLAKVLANTIDTDAGYCFISDLATQLDSISPRLSKSIVTAIEQTEGIRLLYALIDKVTYNSLHNTLNFIFDIDNPMSDQSLNELVVEVPREALKNVKLPQIKNELTSQIFDGAYQFRGNDYQFKG
ncbi:hypothetical protein [Helicobacter pylori]|uniref:hypothetical protein n=1 Tax=Helicobacter pylori TaxID=210 RepID=UPI0002BBD19B|nr:hypothetical protein [Helicobacter pylori]EMH09328.1 hypothetical protein HMPREF1411_01009 [Helicobacter pylori GAM250AFi]EMH12358.1 hypothetical protein HMPREF1413_01566 [Helicobacter pylori GAM252Bi]EMH12473.1 hypothetical protein HMPREF1412_01321 [Helicobacter pylori GAM250T]EMH14419.1 hypothetical protein HMPREF1414_00911 [Helicobacter pylori GAM252T]EMH46984.1 hypothetical protein HMPREF1438_01121 [Helicobacter pylori HP250AFii]